MRIQLSSTISSSSKVNKSKSSHSLKKLVGYEKFVRNNPKSDLFKMDRFHHIEFWCADATNTYKRFQSGLGMSLVAKSDNTTGNTDFCSYVLKSNDLTFAFTAPYNTSNSNDNYHLSKLMNYNSDTLFSFIKKHGFGVRAIGIVVEDVSLAYEISIKHNAIPVLKPTFIKDDQLIAEVKLYGDVVLRFISGNINDKPYFNYYEKVDDGPMISYGLQRLDHAVGNIYNLLDAANYIINFTGMHEFAEFVASDVGTVDSGLNSLVLANNNETILLPLNEPVYGTKRKSQIQTYLEQNNGPGVQHLALKTNDIISTLSQMKNSNNYSKFDFMPKPPSQYYKNLKKRIGNEFSDDEYEAMEELGVLADKDDQGLILQIFTKPISDRATLFFEIIQRIGCEMETIDGNGNKKIIQLGGCGGFGKGNFSELFKSVENYERTLKL